MLRRRFTRRAAATFTRVVRWPKSAARRRRRFSEKWRPSIGRRAIWQYERRSVAGFNQTTGAEIDLTFCASGFDKETVGGVRFEPLRPGIRHPGVHPWKTLSVQEAFGWRDIGVGDQMPGGRREFVGLERCQRNHLDRAR